MGGISIPTTPEDKGLLGKTNCMLDKPSGERTSPRNVPSYGVFPASEWLLVLGSLGPLPSSISSFLSFLPSNLSQSLISLLGKIYPELDQYILSLLLPP